MSDHRLQEWGIRGRASPMPEGIAFLPVFNISDRATIAYEVIARPSSPSDAAAVARRALESAQQNSPAVLFVSFPPALTEDSKFHPADLAQQPGVVASEIAWVLPWGAPGDQTLVDDCRASEFRKAGFLIALEVEGWPMHGHDRIIDVRPDYLLLGADLVARLPESAITRAEVAGLISFATRLEMRLIARGVDDQAIADALIALGVQFGSGSHLSAPLVLESAIALPTDLVVPASWFRQNPPRRLEPPGGATLALTQVADLPAGESPKSDDGFAHELGEIARQLQAEHDPAQILSVIVNLLPRIIPMSALAIFEADWDTDALIPRVVAGSDVVTLRDQPIPMTLGITGWAFTRGLPYNCTNTIAHPAAGTVAGTEDDQNPESLLVVPLVAGDQRIGVLDVWRVGVNAFTTRDLEHCALVAHVAAAAWHNAQLYSQLEERARTDSLTGLHNTRWWEEVAPQEAARSLRSGTSTGVILLDLDHFKLVNDTCGHAVGDRTLRNVARALRSAVRLGDDVVRFGGEEFLVLLRDSGLDGALRVAEDIRQAVATLSGAQGGPGVTASLGVAVFPEHGPCLDDAVRAADLAMYRAKSQGRDRVVAASGPTRIGALDRVS